MLMQFIDICNKNKIFDTLKFKNNVDNKIGVVIAVSGGADSLALADLLHRSQRRFKLNLCIAHFEHGLRGEESLADAEFVKQFANQRKLPCIVESGDVKTFSATRKLSIETAARELRYKFLEEVRQRLNLDSIALAHHADDQAETILMRMLRGTGSVGLSAMQLNSGKLQRPLLNFRKSELEKYCQQRNIIPCVDSTNFEKDTTRNKIRLDLLPLLENYNPLIIENLCKLGEIAANDSDFILLQAQNIFSKAMEDDKLSQSIVKSQHIAIQRALIRLFVEKVVGSAKDFEFIHFESIRKVLIDNLKGVELPHKLRADLKRGWLSIKKNEILLN